jgi:hypothetical protein
MNTKSKKIKLLNAGLSVRALAKLTESEVDNLYSILNEQVTQTVKQVKMTKIPQSTARTTGGVVDGVSIKQDSAGNIIATQTEEELGESELGDDDALGALALQKVTGQKTPHDASDMAPDGMDDDSDNDRSMMGEAKKKKRKTNPWAICTAQMGKEFGTSERSEWSKKQMNKYERCVKDVKKTIEEGKNPISVFVEQKITQIVEKHLAPSITKGELLKFLSEAPTTAPAKPTTKPTTKPGTKPAGPGKNPFPKEHPAPKAKTPSPEQAKEILIGTIMDLIK